MKISILIPSYKRAHLLKWQFESMLKYKINYNYEIIVLNDGIEDDTESVCKKYSDRLNIKYLFTGQRNKEKEHWRMQGYCNNYGVKKASGDIIIIACAEMYHVNDAINKIMQEIENDRKSVVVCSNGLLKDDDGTALNFLQSNGVMTEDVFNKTPNMVKYFLPFICAFDKNEFISIGGYDEDFTGIAYEDDDIMERLQGNGCKLKHSQAKCIHLYHERLTPQNIDNFFERCVFNERLYYGRKGIIKRNINKEWGLL